MPDVTISYKGSQIAFMDASGTKTLLTEGKYCEDDIFVSYNKTGNATAEGDSSVSVNDAESGNICSLIQYGVCEQDAQTNAISCNNGILSVSSGEIVTTAANREAIALGSQTATVENLYSVGNIRDEQELVTGTVTRKNAACIYDGTQPVGDRYISSTGAKDNGAIIIYPLETEHTGDSIVSFTETVKQDVNSLEASIEPIQDLHGYSSPWPAGGGANLFAPYTERSLNGGIAYSVNSNGTIHCQGTATSGSYSGSNLTYAEAPIVLSAGTYTVSAYGFSATGGAQGYMSFGARYSDGTLVQTSGIRNSARTITLEQDAHCFYWIYVQSGRTINEDISIQVEKGSTATSWAPYENICPISGRTGLSVYVSPTQDPADATVYNVVWSTQAGTVYGGTVDVVTGVLTVNKAYKAFDGTEDWGHANNAYFLTVVGPLNSVVNDSAISTHYLDNPTISVGNYQLGFRCYNRSSSPYTGAVVLVRPEAPLTTSLADFKAWLVTQNTNGTPFAVCYELATPVTYQLTPTQVEALVGENNIFSPDATSIKVAVSNPVIEYVAPQPLTLAEGSNTVSATNLSVSSVPLELNYISKVVQPTPTFQSKTISPSTSQQTVTADSGYDGLSSVTVNAMPSGSATTPATTITANPTISINSETGLITASNNKTQSVTPVISTGYVDSGTAGTITVSGSRTYQLLTHGSGTWTPSTYTQRILPPGYYTTGSIYVEGSSNLYPYNIKDGVTIFGVTGTYTGDTHIFDYSNDIEYRGFSPDNSSVTCIADWDKGRAWISGHVEWDAGAEVGEIDFTGIDDYAYLIDSYTSTFWLINEWDPTDIVTGTYSDGVFSVDASSIEDPSSSTPYYLVQVD